MPAKQVHFVWFGNTMSARAKSTIQAWQKFLNDVKSETGETIEISLWLDKAGSSPQSIAGSKIGLDGVNFRDISELSKTDVTPIMRYEADRMHPNYGAASDLARYAILYQKGKTPSMYADLDVLPPKDPSAFIRHWKKSPDLVLAQFPGGDEAPIPATNDLLLVTKAKNPLLKLMLKQAAKFYALTDKKDFPEPHLVTDAALFSQYGQTYSAHDQAMFNRRTQLKTGPALLNTSINLHKKGYTVVQDTDLREPLEDSACSWLGRPVRPFDDESDMLLSIRKSIEYEMNATGILRLDDHLQDAMSCFPGKPSSELRESVMKVVEDIFSNSKNLKKIKSVQLTFKFDESISFYKQHNLVTKSLLHPPNPGDSFGNISQPFDASHKVEDEYGLKQLIRKGSKATYQETVRTPEVRAKTGVILGLIRLYNQSVSSQTDNLQSYLDFIATIRDSIHDEKQLSKYFDFSSDIPLLEAVDKCCSLIGKKLNTLKLQQNAKKQGIATEDSKLPRITEEIDKTLDGLVQEHELAHASINQPADDQELSHTIGGL